jgi:hypothetical protein
MKQENKINQPLKEAANRARDLLRGYLREREKLSDSDIDERLSDDKEVLFVLLDQYYKDAYEHVKKFSGITFEEFEGRCRDSLDNDVFAFDRPTNLLNLLTRITNLESSTGKTVWIKGKTNPDVKSAAGGLIVVDQKLSKLIDQREINYYNYLNLTAIEEGKAKKVQLKYSDGREFGIMILKTKQNIIQRMVEMNCINVLEIQTIWKVIS